MEDNHTTVVDADIRNLSEYLTQKAELCFFGVYDGHSGRSCANYLASTLFNAVLESELKFRKTTKGRLLDNDDNIKKCFLTLDSDFTKKSPSSRPGEASGSTCTTVAIVKTEDEIEVICANVGDSRIVLRHASGKVEPLSFDHKPNNKEEKLRIQNCGGFVEYGRVNGSLALSRAFGDVGYKKNTNLPQEKQAVIALPDIKRVKFNLPEVDDFQFIIVACDGIWDVMTNEQACEFVYQKLQLQKENKYYEQRIAVQVELMQKQGDSEEAIEAHKGYLRHKHEERSQKPGYDLESITEDLLDETVLRLDSKDNVSAIIILFGEGQNSAK